MPKNRARRVELFPLCDVHNILLDALKIGNIQSSTRPDALVFAWLLELPKGIDAGEAAAAVLAVARTAEIDRRSPYQQLLIKELEKLKRMAEANEWSVDPQTLARQRLKQTTNKARIQGAIRASKRNKKRALEKFLLLKGSLKDQPALPTAETHRKIHPDNIEKTRTRGFIKPAPEKPE